MQTPSPVIDKLIEEIGGTLSGALSPEQLARSVQDLHQRFVSARDQTRRQIEAAGDEHRQQNAAVIRHLDEAFGQMDRALRGVERFARSPKPDEGERAVQALERAAWAQQMAMDAYMQAELTHGPTQMPLVNMLIRAREGFAAGQVGRDELESTCRGMQRMAGDARQELLSHETVTPPMQALVDAYQAMESRLEAMVGAIDHDPSELDERLREVTEAGEAVRAAMDSLGTDVMTSGPTPMPHANFVLGTFAAFEAGEVSTEILSETLRVFREAIESEAAEVEHHLKLGAPPEPLLEVVEHVREAYERHRQALDLLDACAKGDASQGQAGREALIEAATMLAAAQDALLRAGEMEGKTACVRCGAPNDARARACGSCGARIPTVAGSESSTMSVHEAEEAEASDFEMTQNLYALFEAVNHVAEGQLAPEAFAATLDDMEGLVRSHLLEPPAVPAPSPDKPDEVQAADMLSKQRDEIIEGAGEFLQALELMRTFLTDGEAHNLVLGVQACRAAATRIQRAQKRIDAMSGGAASAEPPPEAEGPVEA